MKTKRFFMRLLTLAVSVFLVTAFAACNGNNPNNDDEPRVTRTPSATPDVTDGPNGPGEPTQAPNAVTLTGLYYLDEDSNPEMYEEFAEIFVDSFLEGLGELDVEEFYFDLELYLEFAGGGEGSFIMDLDMDIYIYFDDGLYFVDGSNITAIGYDDVYEFTASADFNSLVMGEFEFIKYSGGTGIAGLYYAPFDEYIDFEDFFSEDDMLEAGFTYFDAEFYLCFEFEADFTFTLYLNMEILASFEVDITYEQNGNVLTVTFDGEEPDTFEVFEDYIIDKADGSIWRAV
jgi:hypothetical protein